MTYKELQEQAKLLNEAGADIKVFGVNAATLKESIAEVIADTKLEVTNTDEKPVMVEVATQTIEDLQKQRDDLASSDKKALEIANKLGATIILAEKNGVTLRKGDVEAYVRTDQPDEDIYRVFNGMGIV